MSLFLRANVILSAAKNLYRFFVVPKAFGASQNDAVD